MITDLLSLNQQNFLSSELQRVETLNNKKVEEFEIDIHSDEDSEVQDVMMLDEDRKLESIRKMYNLKAVSAEKQEELLKMQWFTKYERLVPGQCLGESSLIDDEVEPRKACI